MKWTFVSNDGRRLKLSSEAQALKECWESDILVHVALSRYMVGRQARGGLRWLRQREFDKAVLLTQGYLLPNPDKEAMGEPRSICHCQKPFDRLERNKMIASLKEDAFQVACCIQITIGLYDSGITKTVRAYALHARHDTALLRARPPLPQILLMTLMQSPARSSAGTQSSPHLGGNHQVQLVFRRIAHPAPCRAVKSAG